MKVNSNPNQIYRDSQKTIRWLPAPSIKANLIKLSYVVQIEGNMKKFSSGLALIFLISLSCGQSTDPNVELIRNELDAYFNDFVARDFDAIATHF